MLVWGWRVPFLMSIVTLAVAAILRYNMPESSEFTHSREELSEEAIRRAKHAAAARNAADAGSSAAGSTDGHVSVVDVEGQADTAEQKAHYVPVLELFRGYWSGLLLHSLYGACECDLAAAAACYFSSSFQDFSAWSSKEARDDGRRGFVRSIGVCLLCLLLSCVRAGWLGL
jgi:hypothetical protein